MNRRVLQIFESEAEQPRLEPSQWEAPSQREQFHQAKISRWLTCSHSGAHGSSLKHIPSLSDSLVGVLVVQADGALHNITDEATLRHYKVNLGTLGIITHFTITVVPMFKVQWTTIAYDENVLTNGTLLDIARNNDGLYAYWCALLSPSP